MIPTLFSVSYAGLWGQHQLDILKFIEKAARLGYKAVELMGKRPHLSILDWNEAELAKIRDCAALHGIEIATIAGYTDFTAGKTCQEVPFGEMQAAYVRSLARMAQLLGGKIVRVFTGYTTEESAYSDDWNNCIKALRECAAIAADQGIILGVQNHHDIGIATEGFAELLAEVNHSNCRAMFDPWSPALMGEDLNAVARLMAPTMVQTTVADYLRLKRFVYIPGLVNYRPLPEMVRAVPLGKGFVDLKAFFRGLKEGGFDGYVAYEMCSPLQGGGSETNLDATASASLKQIQELAGD
jgi:sugar phosphate isomerase/epimerase